MGRVYNSLVQLLAVRGVQDTQCGFKAMTYEVAQDLFPRLLIHDGSQGPISVPMVTGFDVELLFLANKLGYQLREVPVTWYYGKESKVNARRDSFLLVKDLLTVRWNDLRGRYNRAKDTALQSNSTT
jgi:hypothetical protein